MTNNRNTAHILLQTALVTGITVLSLFLSLPLFSQDGGGETAAAPMERAFGVKGGLNYSTLFVEEAEDVNARMGFHIGLFGRVAPTGGLGFQIEALYSQQGTTVKYVSGAIDQETTYHFDYINAPLMLVIPLGEVAELHGGAYLGAMIVSEISHNGDLGEGTSDPGDAKFNAFDYGLLGGLGINLGRAQIGARYNHGLADMTDNQVSRDVLGHSKNAVAQIYLALALGKGD